VEDADGVGRSVAETLPEPGAHPHRREWHAARGRNRQIGERDRSNRNAIRESVQQVLIRRMHSEQTVKTQRGRNRERRRDGR
jgi:hypothetical protein